jgi:hypothetical protein
MLGIGLALLAAATILLLLALRGRVIARGRFCRNCRFDLAGLNAAAPCPECGCDLSRPRATRAVVRRVRWITLVAATLLMLAGAGMTAASRFPRGLAFYESLPDWVNIHLDRFGVDDARTVIASRSQDPSNFSDAQWNTLIERGLAHQTNTTVPWDTRWGDVLGRGFMTGRMTEEQMGSYLLAGFRPTVTIRDRATLDQPWIGFTVKPGSGRVMASVPLVGSGFSWGIQTRFELGHEIVRSGLKGPSEPPPRNAGRSGGGFRSQVMIPWSAGPFLGGISSSLPSGGFDPINPPAEVVAFVEIQMNLIDRESGAVVVSVGPIRTEQTVRLLPVGSPIVGLVQNESAAMQIRDSAVISGLQIDPGDDAYERRNPANINLLISAGSHAVAGRLYLVSPDGYEIELGEMSVPARTGVQSGLGNTRKALPEDPEHRTGLQAAAKAESVDLVFRTDPSVANRSPEIDSVVNVTMWFRKVPVTVINRGSLRPDQPLVHRPEGANPEVPIDDPFSEWDE